VCVDLVGENPLLPEYKCFAFLVKSEDIGKMVVGGELSHLCGRDNSRIYLRLASSFVRGRPILESTKSKAQNFQKFLFDNRYEITDLNILENPSTFEKD
jgi:hypothetical protein